MQSVTQVEARMLQHGVSVAYIALILEEPDALLPLLITTAHSLYPLPS